MELKGDHDKAAKTPKRPVSSDVKNWFEWAVAFGTAESEFYNSEGIT